MTDQRLTVDCPRSLRTGRLSLSTQDMGYHGPMINEPTHSSTFQAPSGREGEPTGALPGTSSYELPATIRRGLSLRRLSKRSPAKGHAPIVEARMDAGSRQHQSYGERGRRGEASRAPSRVGDHDVMKPTVYIETTIISYLTARPSRDLIAAGHQQITAEWWEDVRPKVDCFVSPFVIQEA